MPAKSSSVPDGKPILVDSDFTSGSVESGGLVSLHLKSESQKRFSELTAQNIGKKVGIVVDGRIVSAPVIKSAITGADIQISGSLSEAEAQALVKHLGTHK